MASAWLGLANLSWSVSPLQFQRYQRNKQADMHLAFEQPHRKIMSCLGRQCYLMASAITIGMKHDYTRQLLFFHEKVLGFSLKDGRKYQTIEVTRYEQFYS